MEKEEVNKKIKEIKNEIDIILEIIKEFKTKITIYMEFLKDVNKYPSISKSQIENQIKSFQRIIKDNEKDLSTLEGTLFVFNSISGELNK